MANSFESISELLQVISSPARLEILLLVGAGEACVCFIESRLGYRQAYISQHLSVLREAGLVQDRRDGWNIFYRVIKPEVFELIDNAGHLNGAMEHGHKPKARSKKKPCPCPKCNPAAEGAKWAEVVNTTVTRIRNLGPYVSYKELVNSSVEEEVKNG